MLKLTRGKTETQSEPPPQEPTRTLNDILEDRRRLDESYWRMSEELSIEYDRLAAQIYK
jgi:hypothetical protein